MFCKSRICFGTRGLSLNTTFAALCPKQCHASLGIKLTYPYNRQTVFLGGIQSSDHLHNRQPVSSDLGVSRVLELLQHVGVLRVVPDLLRLGDRSLHSLSGVSEHQLCAEGTQKHSSLQRHGCWHGEDELVTSGGSDEGQADTRVAAGRLNKHALQLMRRWCEAGSFKLFARGYGSADKNDCSLGELNRTLQRSVIKKRQLSHVCEALTTPGLMTPFSSASVIML